MIAVQEKDAEIKLRIREVIKMRGGNASQLAREMDISAPYFGSILNSSDKGVSATLLKALSNIGIDINWLITGETKVLDELNQKLIDAQNRIDELENNLDFANKLTKELKSMILGG